MHRDMFKIQDGVAIVEKLNCYSFCIFFQNDKISVFNPCFIDNFFKWRNIYHQYVITPNASLNFV